MNYRIIRFKKADKALIELRKYYENKEIINMPVNANLLMNKYKISEGKLLGQKLKMIEEKWVNNSFEISDQEVEKIVKN